MNKVFCPHCGTANPANAQFCSKCGFNLSKGEQRVKSINHTEQPKPKAPAKPAKPKPTVKRQPKIDQKPKRKPAMSRIDRYHYQEKHNPGHRVSTSLNSTWPLMKAKFKNQVKIVGVFVVIFIIFGMVWNSMSMSTIKDIAIVLIVALVGSLWYGDHCVENRFYNKR